VMGPLAGAQEHVITGTVLLAFASGWALLAGLSIRWTDQPQRWATMAAGCAGLSGTLVMLFAPSGATLDALGWIWPPALFSAIAWMIVQAKHSLRSRLGSSLVYSVLGLATLIALGGSYQTIGESIDRRTHTPREPLINVGGHGLYLSCIGSGSPTVVLESGLGEASTYWEWIAPAIAADTRVCVYDRAGRGWSEPASLPQDGVDVATDLHTLLNRAHETGPFVLVGHSSGAQYVRIFAGRYPLPWFLQTPQAFKLKLSVPPRQPSDR
jgi:hypothetical protein